MEVAMHDVLDDVARWYDGGERFALATVVGTWRSAPRQPGAAMAMTADGEPVGSVSGGCVEGAVYELSHEVLATGEPVLQRYGVSDDDAFAVGLTCGGIIDIFVEPVDATTFPQLPEVVRSVQAHQPVAVATVIDGPGNVGAHLVVWPDRAAGSLGSERLDAAVIDDGRGMLDHGATGVLRIGPDGERRQDELSVFVQSFAPAPRMLVFGAIDFARAVARVGKFLGYRVTVCDARGVFATPKRFPEADEVVVEWPHRYLEHADIDSRTVLCVLTHDPKFDVPLLEAALKTDAAYIGAMGSRRTHEDRLARLRDEGVPEEDLARIASPIGGDRGVDRGRDRGAALGRQRAAAGRDRGTHPQVTGGRPTSGVAGLVLAAGAGRRLGRPKALLELDGERLVDRAVRALRDAGCDPVVVVVGAAPLPVPAATVIENPDWSSGMASSVRVGLAALDAAADTDTDTDAVVVMMVDTPGIGAAVVRRLVDAHDGGATVAVATYDGLPRNPVLLGRQHWDEVTALAVGDVGARAFLARHPELVTRVECGDVGDPADVDTADDWAAALDRA
jgi:xanthine dehydrogenase accessory factor